MTSSPVAIYPIFNTKNVLRKSVLHGADRTTMKQVHFPIRSVIDTLILGETLKSIARLPMQVPYVLHPQ